MAGPAVSEPPAAPALPAPARVRRHRGCPGRRLPRHGGGWAHPAIVSRDRIRPKPPQQFAPIDRGLCRPFQVRLRPAGTLPACRATVVAWLTATSHSLACSSMVGVSSSGGGASSTWPIPPSVTGAEGSFESPPGDVSSFDSSPPGSSSPPSWPESCSDSGPIPIQGGCRSAPRSFHGKRLSMSTPSGSESPASTSKGLMAKSQARFHRFGSRPERRT